MHEIQTPKSRQKRAAPSCATCRHAIKANDTEGHCWRYPPTLIGPNTSTVPPVKLEWTCGEYAMAAKT